MSSKKLVCEDKKLYYCIYPKPFRHQAASRSSSSWPSPLASSRFLHAPPRPPLLWWPRAAPTHLSHYPRFCRRRNCPVRSLGQALLHLPPALLTALTFNRWSNCSSFLLFGLYSRVQLAPASHS